ncbi:MAG: sigma-70 family RNA polymerase sigma factor [Armatimonadetes bacterium]|jgi:RNA polymerase sigma-70 factor (ECF subfamily)|nr:sigma-70 family RNA polymerase sigma factor [Armatimonadota bacterium]
MACAGLKLYQAACVYIIDSFDRGLQLEKAEAYNFSASNEELLELCKRQDQEALRLLLRRHERPVYSLLYRMLSNHEDSEEALAEVFVKVWRGAAFFKGNSSFTTWLYRIASNTAKDFLRSRKTRRDVSMEDIVINELDIIQRSNADSGDPSQRLMEAEDRTQILRAMEGLSENDRLLINLYHFQECDYSQLAEITGIAPNILKVRLFRARQRLRKLCIALEEGDNNELRTSTTESSGLQQKAAEWS